MISSELGEKQEQSLSAQVVLASDLIGDGPREAEAESRCTCSVGKRPHRSWAKKQKQSLVARVLLASDFVDGAGKEAEAESQSVRCVGKRSHQSWAERSRSRVSVHAFCWQAILSTELGKKQSLSLRVLLASDLIDKAGLKDGQNGAMLQV